MPHQTQYSRYGGGNLDFKKIHFLQKNAISRVDKMAVFEIFAFGKASFDGGERRGGPWSKKSKFFFFPFLVPKVC